MRAALISLGLLAGINGARADEVLHHTMGMTTACASIAEIDAYMTGARPRGCIEIPGASEVLWDGNATTVAIGLEYSRVTYSGRPIYLRTELLRPWDARLVVCLG